MSANPSCCSAFGMTLPSTWVFRFQSEFHSSGPSAHFAKLLQLNSSISSAEAEAGQGADRDLNHKLLHSHHGAAITAADHRLGLLVVSGRSWIVIRTRVGPDTGTRRWKLITNSGVVWRMLRTPAVSIKMADRFNIIRSQITSESAICNITSTPEFTMINICLN